MPKIFAFGIMQRVERSPQNLLRSAQEHGQLLHSVERGRLEAAKAMMEESMRRAQAEDVKDLNRVLKARLCSACCARMAVSLAQRKAVQRANAAHAPF